MTLENFFLKIFPPESSNWTFKDLWILLYIHFYLNFRNTFFIFSATAAAKSLQLCPTLCDPIDLQPTRLPHPWDSPGKNTGVGCHIF